MGAQAYHGERAAWNDTQWDRGRRSGSGARDVKPSQAERLLMRAFMAVHTHSFARGILATCAMIAIGFALMIFAWCHPFITLAVLAAAYRHGMRKEASRRLPERREREARG